MSTIITNLISTLNTEIPTITGFSTKKKLSNPYVIENNDAKKLQNGWGFTIGPSEVSLMHLSSTRQDQIITVVLSKRVSGSDLKSTHLEAAIRDIANDMNELKIYLTSNTAFTYPSGVVDISAVNTSGFEYLDDNENERYITNSMTFNVIVDEALA